MSGTGGSFIGAAGTVGSALEQGISRGHVDLGESLLSGAGNALSEVLYGTGPIKGVKDAFLRGARTGAVMSGMDNIARAAGIRGTEPGINPGGGGRSRGAAEAVVPGYTGRDPKGMCGAADPFDLSSGLGNGRGYRSGRAHGGSGHSRTGEGGFSLGGFVRDVLTGAVVGGLGSAGFYGAGKAVEVLRGSVAGRGSGIKSDDVYDMYRKTSNLGDFKDLDQLLQLKNVKKVANSAGIGLNGISLKIDRNPELVGKGIYGYTNGKTIILYPDAFTDIETLVKTLGHERTHIYQAGVFGKPSSIDALAEFEKAAYRSEKDWWKYYNFINGGKR